MEKKLPFLHTFVHDSGEFFIGCNLDEAAAVVARQQCIFSLLCLAFFYIGNDGADIVTIHHVKDILESILRKLLLCLVQVIKVSDISDDTDQFFWYAY